MYAFAARQAISAPVYRMAPASKWNRMSAGAQAIPCMRHYRFGHLATDSANAEWLLHVPGPRHVELNTASKS